MEKEMKTNIFLFITIFNLLILTCSITPQEIEAKLGGITSNYGFSIKDINSKTLFRVSGDGKVGIGLGDPSRELEVNGVIGWGTMGAALNTDQGASIELRGNGTPYIDFSNDQSDYKIRLILDNDNVLGIYGGSVGIGTSNTSGYKLAVAGNVIAEEIVVKLKQDWPDYVFDKNYKKTDLKELDNYISLNKHLPNLPNAANVNNKGIKMGELQIKLLEKIEELTLYIIDQNKEIENLKSEYNLLKEKVEQNLNK